MQATGEPAAQEGLKRGMTGSYSMPDDPTRRHGGRKVVNQT